MTVMKHFDIHFYTLSLLFLAYSGGAGAQNDSPDEGLSVAGTELLKDQKLWSKSGNAAGTAFDNTRNYSRLHINYESATGDFHRAYTGKTVRDANIYTEGFLNLDKVFVWGEFRFTHENVSGARFNASITDPYRGQPYFVADDGQESAWRNQHYHLKFRAATPVVFGRFTFGLEGTYKAQVAAKQLDPRVTARFFTLQLAPGVTYSLNDHDAIGAHLTYASVKEESEMTLENNKVQPHYYELYGLGTAHHGIGSGRTTNYFGNRWGIGVQYGHHDNAWDVLAELTFNKYVENNEISFTTPRKDGLVEDKAFGATFQAIRHGQKLTHQADLTLQHRAINGIMYLSQRDNTEANAGWIILHHDVRSTFKTTDLGLRYALIANRGAEYDWRADVNVGYRKHNDKFLLPLSTKNSENIYLGLDAKKNFSIGRSMHRRLLIGLNAQWKNAISGAYSYGGANPELTPVTLIEPLDEAYLLSDAWRCGALITYSQLLKPHTKVNGYAQVAFDYAHTRDFDFHHRSCLSLTVGLNF